MSASWVENRLKELQRYEEIRQLFRDGKTFNEIAELFDTSRTYIRTICRRDAGLRKQIDATAHAKKGAIRDRNNLIVNLCEEGRTFAEIGRSMSLSISSIRDIWRRELRRKGYKYDEIERITSRQKRI